MKLATIVGTRPEIIRLSRVIAHADRIFEHTLIHTGQNYSHSLNQVFFDEMLIRKADIFLDAVGDDLGMTVGNIIAGAYKTLKDLAPDACLVLGDTNSCIAAYAAKRLKIPIFHMEAGNRCFDVNVPEEINRRLVDHLADINLPYSQIARSYLLREGFPPDRIIVTGSPMFEVLQYYSPQIESSDIVNRLGLKAGGFALASIHREENVDDCASLTRIIDGLSALNEQFGLQVILSTHPRTRANLEKFDIMVPQGVRTLEPLGFFDYNKLQKSARICVSDSGTIFEEAAILGFKAISLRGTHERPEAMECGVAVLVDPSRTSIAEAVRRELSEDAALKGTLPIDYSAPNVSQKVMTIIKSYTEYVNRYVWQKT